MKEPFLLAPAGKDYLGSGQRLKDKFGKNLSLTPLAKTWEYSTHLDGLSTISSGPFQGQTLKHILAAHPHFIGTHPQVIDGELPILVKLIDAYKDLSIQVHPSHEQAAPLRGKAELWYILSASSGATISHGFNTSMTKAKLKKSIENKTLPNYLHKFPVHAHDVFYIAPGTVHSLGAGIVLVEVQENSNLTYRLYDYDRTDKNGKKRPLHISKALEIAHLQPSYKPDSFMRVIKYQPGLVRDLLGRCSNFLVYRISLNCQPPLEITGKCQFLQINC